MSINANLQEDYDNDTATLQSINLICPICDNQCSTKEDFHDYLHIHTENVQCLKEDINDKSQAKLNNSSQEKINSFHENIIRSFKCVQCNLTFDRASQYDYHHRSIHLGEKSQLCEICGKGFFRKADLRTHLNIHLGTNACICEICGRKFNHISNLIRHGRMHAGIKPYPCSICGKRFTQISSLARHKRIHDRLKEDQGQNNHNNTNSENENCMTSKNKVFEGNVPAQQKVFKRQHYCKICGESFNFIFLLREHEKSHTKNTTNLENESNNMKITVAGENNSYVNNIDFVENEMNIKKVLPLDTIIYITSEQLKKINLENIENTKNFVTQEDQCKENEKIQVMEELNISEKLVPHDDQTQLPHNNSVFLCKSNNSIAKENVIYMYQVDEPVLKNRLCTKYPNNHEQLSCMQMYESDYQKTDMLQNYNALPNDSVNVTDMFQKMDVSESNINEHGKSDLNVQNDKEINSVPSEKDLIASNDVNNSANHDEPMLRLVQTETGEQFYEFLINNLVDKSSNITIKASENKDESTNISEHVANTCLDIKNINEDVHQEQNIQSDIHNDLNYTQYEFQGEEKNFVGNQILLDQQSDFDKYVETNFEVFDRLNYDDSPERFLEFVENAGVENQDSKALECKDNEPLLQFQSFSEIDSMVENEKNDAISDNEQILLNSLKEGTQCDINSPIKPSIEKTDKQIQTEDIIESYETIEEQQEETKKSKEFLLKFQCTVCEKSFSTSYNYKQHIGTHFADQQKFHCKECKMSFAWKSTLNKHIASNHRPEGPQKFACDICQKIYNTSSQVNEHVKRDHLKQRNHVCSHCGKSFFKKYDLKIHNRIHTDERPYVCRACGKRFHHRSHIIRHERIHF
ncbi:uncharacterized protein LOC143188975 [Calliopsis andreniformis]|uniref:uncharacterized protein LOC143188975 n=1 Tax=Calliopsis andreniformis TaxID=337506 RepID=UPI003FCDFEAB